MDDASNEVARYDRGSAVACEAEPTNLFDMDQRYPPNTQL